MHVYTNTFPAKNVNFAWNHAMMDENERGSDSLVGVSAAIFVDILLVNAGLWAGFM